MPQLPSLIVRTAAALSLLGVFAPAALAYPGSIVFTPTGEAAGFGEGNYSFYQSFYRDGPSGWAGLNIGLVPRFEYFGTGLAFGGLEVGIDVAVQPGLNPDIKPMANFKAQLFEEYGWLPHTAVGLLDYAFLHPTRSLSFAYTSATHSMGWGKTEWGRATLGMGYVLSDDPDQFEATWPTPDSKLALLAGWEFPSVGPFTFAIDHMGGSSEVGGTNAVINLEIAESSYASVGYSFGHDRTALQPDSYFIQLYTNFDSVKLLTRKPGAVAEAEDE